MLEQLEHDSDVVKFIDDGGEILYFTASWCKPCIQYGPVIEHVADAADVRIAKINVDTVTETTTKYHIKAVPTLVRVDGAGNVINRITGVNTSGLVTQFIT